MFKEELLNCCYEVWRLGYKREKALQYISDKLGYTPLEGEYVEHFKEMFDRAFGQPNKVVDL